jgi:K+-transporting ATPase ATPase C chain
MKTEIRSALLTCVVSFVLCAVAYPALVYGLGQTLFPRQAQGSLIEKDGHVIGSALIAQPFVSDRYFWPRPSAASYAADASTGSNLATTNPALRDRMTLDACRWIANVSGDSEIKAMLKSVEADTASPIKSKLVECCTEIADRLKIRVPVELVTTSGAGLDPEITLEAARYQAERVARSRQVSLEKIIDQIEQQANHSGELIGAPARVNVLLLNLALDANFSAK